MRIRCRAAALAGVVAALPLIAGCGSQSTTRTRTVTVTRSAAAGSASSKTVAGRATATGPTTGTLPGASGRKATPASLQQFSGRPPLGPTARLAGVQGMSRTQEQGQLLGNVAQFWQAWFSQQGRQLPAGSYTLVTGTARCGSVAITAASPPSYCPSNSVIYLPQTTVQRQIEPLGDSALLYVLAYLYAQHVGDAVGVTPARYSSTKIPRVYSCFSGVYFLDAEAEGLLQPTDMTGLDRILIAIAPHGSKVTSPELTEAFNKGLLSNFHPSVCLQ